MKSLAKLLLITPKAQLYHRLAPIAKAIGDEIALSFGPKAKDLITSENIGADDVTDYLSISFSSTDYVGHFFGASSLESEDNLHRLDRTLTDLFSFIDKTVR